jgi:hypothetical protein
VERELDEELSFHIERETQKHIGGGRDYRQYLRRDVVPIARIERGFANVLQAQNLRRQTFD